jgi:hypothetical protein
MLTESNFNWFANGPSGLEIITEEINQNFDASGNCEYDVCITIDSFFFVWN